MIPTCAVAWFKPSASAEVEGQGFIGRTFAKWQQLVEDYIKLYGRSLDTVLEHRVLTVVLAYGALALVLIFLTLPLRREFFPQADAGSFEIFCRAPSGARLAVTNERVADVENFIRKQIPKKDLKLLVSEIGVTPDWSSAYTHNAGKMDSIIRVQLTPEREKGSYEYADQLRRAFAREPRFHDLEFAFNAGGLIRGALNEGKVAPINVRVTGKQMKPAHLIADRIRRDVAKIDGVVDARVIQRLNYPEYVIEVDRAKAADLGLTQEDVMKCVIAAFNSSIQYNKTNFWIDQKSGNQYFVGVQYPLQGIESLETLLDVPITGINQWKLGRRAANIGESPSLLERANEPNQPVAAPVSLSTLVTLRRSSIPTEITHVDISPSVDLLTIRKVMSVEVEVYHLLATCPKPLSLCCH